MASIIKIKNNLKTYTTMKREEKSAGSISNEKTGQEEREKSTSSISRLSDIKKNYSIEFGGKPFDKNELENGAITAYVQLKGTPFSLVQVSDKENKKVIGVTISVGSNIISALKFDNEEAATNYLESKPWEIIWNLCSLISNNINKQ